VVNVDEDFAYVETQRQSACGGCNSQEGCGTSALSTVLGGKPTRFKVINGVGAKVGDSVVIGLEEKALLKSSLIAYLFPVIGLVLGVAVALLLIPQAGDGATVIGAAAGLLAGFVGLKQVNSRNGNSLEYMPVILRLSNAWKVVAFAGGPK
jgi:sigma-E factor negative regulatory protein RseC